MHSLVSEDNSFPDFTAANIKITNLKKREGNLNIKIKGQGKTKRAFQVA